MSAAPQCNAAFVAITLVFIDAGINPDNELSNFFTDASTLGWAASPNVLKLVELSSRGTTLADKARQEAEARDMNIASFVLPLLLVLVYVPMLNRVARPLGLVDKPNARKRHRGAIPLVGGLAMFAAFTTSSMFLGTYRDVPLAFYFGAAVLLVLGLCDDLKPLPALPRLVIQAAAIWMAVSAGGNLLSDLGQLVSPTVLELGRWTVPLTVFGLLGVVNAVNLSDGADGLAGGVAISAIGWFAVVFAYLASDGALPAGFDPSRILLALLGVLTGFLVFNLRAPWRRRACIFMGDAGSLFLGFVLGWFAVSAAGQPGMKDLSPVSALWILIVPMFDTISCMLRRVLQGRSPMSPDRQHAHHLLQDWGLSTGQTVAVLIAINTLAGLIGVASWRLSVPGYWMFGALAACFAAYMGLVLSHWGVGRRLVRPAATSAPALRSTE